MHLLRLTLSFNTKYQRLIPETSDRECCVINIAIAQIVIPIQSSRSGAYLCL